MNAICKRMLIMSAITNVAIPTGLINGFIAWFSTRGLTDITFAAMRTDMIGGAIGCGLIIPFFGPLILWGQLKKMPNLQIGLAKKNHVLARYIPQNIFFGACVIAIMMGIIFAGIPFGLGTLLGLDFAVSLPVWLVFKTVYSGIIAMTAGYLGILNTLYGYAATGKASLGD